MLDAVYLRDKVRGLETQIGVTTMNRNTDIMKQGFMKVGKAPKAKPFDEAAWRKANVEAARKRYAEMED